MKEEILTEKAPKPIGPYSQAIKSNGFIFLSGIIPIRTTGEMTKGDIAEQFQTIMGNAKSILEAAGSSLEKVVKVTVYMKDLRDFEAMNKVYASTFSKPFPARTTVQVAALPRGVDIEVDFIATT